MMETEVKFLKKLSFLFEPARLKVIFGGRGAGKTEGVATALIALTASKKLRVVCFRELQTSISESVYETLKNRIIDMNLDNEFDIQKTTIISKRTLSEFIFSGLRYNIDKIKSMSRIDIAWIEEARNVSKVSLDKLEPTIRGRAEDDPNGLGGPFGFGPECWLTFNPELDSDEVYKRFVIHKDKFAPDFTDEVSLEDREFYYLIRKKQNNGEPINLSDFEKVKYESIKNKRYAFVEKINYQDNKFFPPDLRRLMLLTKSANEDDYLHVWEGHTKQVLDGAIYAEEIRKVIKEKRLGKVPYDSSRPVNTYWDLGRNDSTAIWFIQSVGMEFNVINYYEDRLKKMPFYINVLQQMGYNYGIHNLPHDGAAETLSNITPERQLRNMNIGKVRIIKAPIKKFIGINAGRTVFDLANFDEEKTADGFTCLKRYCYSIDEETGGFSKEPKHDIYSNGADAWQTFSLSLKQEAATKKPLATVGSNPRTLGTLRSGSTSWMG